MRFFMVGSSIVKLFGQNYPSYIENFSGQKEHEELENFKGNGI